MTKTTPKLFAAVAIAVASLVFTTPASRVAAAGTPNVTLTKSMPGEVLFGAPGIGGPVPGATVIPVTLTLENTTTDNGFNASFNDVLPAGVSYVPGSSNPEPTVIVPGDGTTVLVWSNVADSLAGTTVTIDFEIAADITAYDLTTVDMVANSANAYVNSNPRLLPRFDPVTGQVVASTATGNDSSTAQTRLIPFELTKIQRDAESELLRGVHDHQTVYTLRVDNNFVNQTTNFEIVDYIPATMEFLGCGTVDNTTYDDPDPGDGEEYPGSGGLNPGNAPPVNDCPTPSSVTTVTEDGTGSVPAGVYTRVAWDSASLAAALGSEDLAAGAFFEIDYVAAIPLRANVDDGSTADPTANLDNNTGALTTEVASAVFPQAENSAENYAAATGDYNDAVTSTDDDTASVFIEDVSIHKTVSDPKFVQGDTPFFTLTIESSEYTTSTGPITVTDTLPASLDLTGATPAPTSGPVLDADGSHTYTWVRPAFTGASSTDTIVINTLVREFYRDGVTGLDSTEPVSANQSYTNTTDLVTDATIITDNDGTETTQSVVDESSASQSSDGPTILKEVSEPTAGPFTCGDGSAALPTYDDDFASSYRPGDRVCFRLNVDFPGNLDTNDTVVQDFLPAGFAYEGFQYGSANTVTPTTGIVFDASEAPLLSWTLPDNVDQGTKFQVVISTIVSDPSAAASGDLLENLQKMRWTDGGTEVFQLRDDALAEWSEAEVALTKGVITVNGVPVPGAPADGVTVEQSDIVRYQIDLVNNGTAPALDVSVRDVLPPGITCADVDPLGPSISNGGVCDGANDWIQWDPADDIDLAANGGTASLIYDVRVPASVAPDASFVNEAGVREYTGETNTGTPFTYVPSNNIDPTQGLGNTDPARDPSEIVTAVPSIAKTRGTSINDTAQGNNNGEATIGETISYTVTVTLPDNLTYFDAEITDVVDAEKDLDVSSVVATLDGSPLPIGFTLTADDGANSITLDFPATYTVPNGPDQVVVITFDAVVLDVAANTRDTNTPNTATFTFIDGGSTLRNLTATANTRIVEPNIVLDKANGATGPVAAGDAIDYTLTLTNDDTPNRVSAGYDTVVVDTVPADLIVLDAPGGNPVLDGGTVGPNGGIWNLGARQITWNVGTVLPGGPPVTLGYQVEVDSPLIAAGVLTNTANATTTSMPGVVPGERTSTSAQGGPGSGYQDPAESSVSVPVFSLTKDATPAIVTVGETVSYAIDVTIPGGVIAYDVTVIDQVPPGIVFEGLTGVTCDQGGSTCVPTVAIGDVTTIPASGSTSGDDVAFFFDDVFDTPAAAARVVTITYTGYVADDTNADDGATLTNTAIVRWNDSDVITTPPSTVPVPGDFTDSSPTDDAAVDTVEPTLVIDKDVNAEGPVDDARRAVPGETLTYSLGVTNTGTSPAYDVTVEDGPSDDTWAFVDTTVAAGVTNTDANPVGGLAWTIDGPIAPTETVTITYTLTVPAAFDETDENATGPEQVNTADIPSYFGVDDRSVNPTRYREYDDVTPDTVSIELDLASIGDYVWFDVNDDGVQGLPADEPPLAGVPVTVTYLGIDNAPGGGDDEVFNTVTLADGSYLVENLPGGQYLVEVDDTALVAAGFEPSFDLDGGTATPNSAWSGALGEDEAKRDVDFGYTGTGSIGDTVWFDQDLDGFKDANEAGLGGVARPGRLVRAGQRPGRHRQHHVRHGDRRRRHLPGRQPPGRRL